jgi:glycosyltransferase involved in cell wall biosynthesis
MNAKKKIGISARGVGAGFTGPNSYTRDFTQELIRQAQGCEIHIYYNSPKHLGFIEGGVEHVVPGSNLLLWDHVLLPLQMNRDRISLAIFPKGTASFFPPCKTALITLDLGYFYNELSPYRKLNTIYMKYAMRYSAQKAEVVFTISEHTRQDVLRFLDVPDEKTLNIQGAASANYRPVRDPAELNAIRHRFNLREPFIFFPTNVSPRKNFMRILDAFETIQESIPHHLYFTGNITWDAGDVFKRLDGPISNRVHQLGEVPRENMAGLYTLAQFTIYPSLFEGLGLPVLEAFQCGSPVLTSAETSLPEIAGDAALIVDAYSVDSIAQGMYRMATDANLRSGLRRKGFERAELFTWEKTVKKVLQYFERQKLPGSG